jgi:glucan phosphoethanolaminetransferase (alkaline phosphatase superfamily)
MAPESPEFRSQSLTLFAAGFAVLLLSIAFAHSADPTSQDTAPTLTEQLPYLLPTFVGGLLSLIASMRISTFARAWNLVLAGPGIYFAAWFIPHIATLLPAFKDFNGNTSTLLALGIFRIVGLFFFSTGILKLLLLRRKTSDEQTAGRFPPD